MVGYWTELGCRYDWDIVKVDADQDKNSGGYRREGGRKEEDNMLCTYMGVIVEEEEMKMDWARRWLIIIATWEDDKNLDNEQTLGGMEETVEQECYHFHSWGRSMDPVAETLRLQKEACLQWEGRIVADWRREGTVANYGRPHSLYLQILLAERSFPLPTSLLLVFPCTLLRNLASLFKKTSSLALNSSPQATLLKDKNTRCVILNVWCVWFMFGPIIWANRRRKGCPRTFFDIFPSGVEFSNKKRL